MFSIRINSAELDSFLAKAEEVFSDTTPFMQDIAEYLLVSTKDRIANGGPAPDGRSWAPKAQATLNRYRQKGEGVDSRPLIHMGFLFGGIASESGKDYAAVGSNAVYAAIQQWGAKKGSSGGYAGTDKNGRAYSGVAPWGDIPARPFLGISADDELEIAVLFKENLIAQLGAHFA